MLAGVSLGRSCSAVFLALFEATCKPLLGFVGELP